MQPALRSQAIRRALPWLTRDSAAEAGAQVGVIAADEKAVVAEIVTIYQLEGSSL